MNEDLECPRCHKLLPKTTDYYFIRIGQTEPYWQGPKPLGCKACYKIYRKELRLKNKNTKLLPTKAIEKAMVSITDSESFQESELSTDEFKELLKPINGYYIGDGISRIGFGIGKKYVLKIAKSMHGIHQNTVEIKNYQRIKKLSEEKRKYFVPLLAWDKKNNVWIVVPKAKVVHSGLTSGKAWEIERQVSEDLAKLGIHLEDLHDENVGLLGEQPVVIDYGLSMTIEGEGR